MNNNDKTANSISTMTKQSSQLKVPFWPIFFSLLFIFVVFLNIGLLPSSSVKIAEVLKPSAIQFEWISNIYVFVLASLLLPSFFASNRIDIKKSFVIGLLLFFISSLLAIMFNNPNYIILFVFVSALGAALSLPSVFSFLNNFYGNKGYLTGILLLLIVAAFIISPMIGQELSSFGLGSSINDLIHISRLWKYEFFINILISFFTFLSLFRYFDNKYRAKIDSLSFFLSLAFSILFTFSFINGSQYGWFLQKNPFLINGTQIHIGNLSIIPFLIFLAFILFLFFISRINDEITGKKIAALTLNTLLLILPIAGILSLLSLSFQMLKGYSEIRSGFLFLIFFIPFTITLLALVSSAKGTKTTTVIGLLLSALSGVFLAQSGASNVIIIPLLFFGLGSGLALSSVLVLVFGRESMKAGVKYAILVVLIGIFGIISGLSIAPPMASARLSGNIIKNIQAIPDLSEETKNVIVYTLTSGGQANSAQEQQKEFQTALINSIIKNDLPPNQSSDTASLSSNSQTQSDAQAALSSKLNTVAKEVNNSIQTGFSDSISQSVLILSLLFVVAAIPILILL